MPEEKKTGYIVIKAEDKQYTDDEVLKVAYSLAVATEIKDGKEDDGWELERVFCQAIMNENTEILIELV